MGGTGGLDPLKNHKNLGFLSNTGPDPLKNHKATKPAFNVGYLDHLSSQLKKKKKRQKFLDPR